jgi:hypothetical protein
MKAYRRAHGGTVQTADNDVRACSIKIIRHHGANAEKTKWDGSIQKPRPALQAVALTCDLIAERAMAIWLERGCPRDRDEENWREAEAQLKTELGIG